MNSVEINKDKDTNTNSVCWHARDVCSHISMSNNLTGHNASFPLSKNSYRHLVFRFMTSWGDRPYMHPAEIMLYSIYVE
jgi:hypothetical protein